MANGAIVAKPIVEHCPNVRCRYSWERKQNKKKPKSCPLCKQYLKPRPK
jgi:hypothetical protein